MEAFKEVIEREISVGSNLPEVLSKLTVDYVEICQKFVCTRFGQVWTYTYNMRWWFLTIKLGPHEITKKHYPRGLWELFYRCKHQSFECNPYIFNPFSQREIKISSKLSRFHQLDSLPNDRLLSLTSKERKEIDSFQENIQCEYKTNEKLKDLFLSKSEYQLFDLNSSPRKKFFSCKSKHESIRDCHIGCDAQVRQNVVHHGQPSYILTLSSNPGNKIKSDSNWGSHLLS